MPTYYPKIALCSIATAERIQPAAVRTDVERHKSFKFIYEVCLRPDANATSACTVKMQWRAVGGTWADLSSTGALKYTTGTDLVNDTALTAENCIYDGVPTFTYVEGKECTDGQVDVPVLDTDQYTMIQFAVDPAGATDGTEYEFRFINTTDSNSVVPEYSTGIDSIPEYIAHTPVTRYWIGGTGYWNYVSHWSETSGGSPYATAPLEMDTVVFDENCGGGMVTHLEGYRDIHCHFVTTGIPSGMELRVFVNRITLISDLTGFDKLTFLECTLNTNNYDITVSSGIMFGQSGDVGTYNLGTSTITVTNDPSPGYITIHTDGVVDAADAKLVMYGGSSSAANPASISLGAKSVGELDIQFETSSNKITVGANATVGKLSVSGDGLLSSSSTFTVSGTISIDGDTAGGLSFNGLDLTKTSGTVSATKSTITSSTASGGATFVADELDGNVDGGNNSGWIFARGIKIEPGSCVVTGSSIQGRYCVATLSAQSGSVSLQGKSVTLKHYRLALSPGAFSVASDHVSLSDTHYRAPSVGGGATIWNDFEHLDLINLDSDMWGGATVAGGWTLNAEHGEQEVTGTAVVFTATRKLSIASGSLTEAGTAVNLKRNCPLSVAAGSIGLSGTAVSLMVTRKIAAASKGLTLSGTALVLARVYPPLEAASWAGALTGTAVSLATGRKMAAANGAIVETGQSIDLMRTALISAASGSMVLTGTAAGLMSYRGLSIASGAIVVTGTPVTFSVPRHFAADPGAFTATGQTVGLFAARKLSSDTKTLALSGQAISLLSGRRFGVASGSVQEAGSAIDLLKGRVVQVLFGNVTVSGPDVGLKRFAKLLIDAGAVSFRGSDVDVRNVFITTGAGSFVVTGSAVSFTKTRTERLQTVYATAIGKNAVSAERVRRATAQPRITGV